MATPNKELRLSVMPLYRENLISLYEKAGSLIKVDPLAICSNINKQNTLIQEVFMYAAKR